ncbi:MAG: hypothetical protein KA105_00550 [Caulobacter sp.]|nr:hypothetical protein [Caulobacter sp.]
MRLISLLLATLLGGCALTGGDRPPVCDGKHRRPANPNGSVLSPVVAAPQPVAAAGAASDAGAETSAGSCRR